MWSVENGDWKNNKKLLKLAQTAKLRRLRPWMWPSWIRFISVLFKSIRYKFNQRYYLDICQKSPVSLGAHWSQQILKSKWLGLKCQALRTNTAREVTKMESKRRKLALVEQRKESASKRKYRTCLPLSGEGVVSVNTHDQRNTTFAIRIRPARQPAICDKKMTTEEAGVEGD